MTYRWELGRLPGLMGIVNSTPDSFSDGGQFIEPQQAIAQGLKLAGEGAQVLDIGGESTRPGAAPVSLVEELRRVMPIIEGLVEQTDVPLSIDTTKAEVARQALAAGASIVNDISGLTFDPRMTDVCAESSAGVICMHIRGTPATMQREPRYTDVVAEVSEYLERRLEALEKAGICRERVVLDPGIGFGKTAEHNLLLLGHIARLRELGRPVLIGHSRKRFLDQILNRKVEQRTAGTLGVAVALASQHVDLIRVHDVAAARDCLQAWQAVTGQAALP